MKKPRSLSSIFIQNTVEKNVEHNIKSLATKEDAGKLKEELTVIESDLRTEIAVTKVELKVEIATAKSDTLRVVYVVGLVQFLAIVGSVTAIINVLAN